MASNTYDIIVLGGGPAGAFAAGLLRREGLSVAIVDSDQTPSRIEGLSRRVVSVFKGSGIAIGQDVLGGLAERRSFWTGTTSAENSEYLVDRKAFDTQLRAHAVSAGAVLFRDIVDGVENDQDGVVVTTRDGVVLRAPFAIDARGRRAPRDHNPLRGPRTISASTWDAAGGHHGHPRTTIIPAANGWIWTAEPGDGRRWLQVCFDAGLLKGSGSDAVAAAVRCVLAGDTVAENVDCRVDEGAPLLVRACETIFANPRLTPPVIRIGDAAAGLDPLSGHGMFWAVSSALMAVPIVKALMAGGDTEMALARRFYEQRIAETFIRQSRVGRDFYRLETRWRDAPFWRDRCRWPDDEPIHTELTEIAVQRSIVVADGQLREADVLVTPQHPSGVAWVAGVPIVPVYEQFCRMSPSERNAAPTSSEFMPGATPQQADAVMAWLHRQGLAAVSAAASPIGGTDT